ncbi:DUF6479 family protein [Streptomyces orinoci]|uniref:DUF6479 family protein n=1 Tax=Streptomyces orinoci TaxID=67339 RepID=A0ABV3K391_STRON|nr:DUF6479 family protein [Streptomyces orinoci]
MKHIEIALPAYLGGIAPFIVGIAVAVLLLLAFVFGMRWRDREPPPPSAPQRRMGSWRTPEEDGRPVENHGPGHNDDEDVVGYVTEHRAPEDIPPGQPERILPHELSPGSHPEELSEERKKWRPGSSGSFGSGGAGHH